MPLPIIDNEGPDQAAQDIRQREIRERIERARQSETVQNMIARYYEYLERDGEL